MTASIEHLRARIYSAEQAVKKAEGDLRDAEYRLHNAKQLLTHAKAELAAHSEANSRT